MRAPWPGPAAIDPKVFTPQNRDRCHRHFDHIVEAWKVHPCLSAINHMTFMSLSASGLSAGLERLPKRSLGLPELSLRFAVPKTDACALERAGQLALSNPRARRHHLVSTGISLAVTKTCVVATAGPSRPSTMLTRIEIRRAHPGFRGFSPRSARHSPRGLFTRRHEPHLSWGSASSGIDDTHLASTFVLAPLSFLAVPRRSYLEPQGLDRSLSRRSLSRDASPS